jgi:hypothetical protein
MQTELFLEGLMEVGHHGEFIHSEVLAQSWQNQMQVRNQRGTATDSTSYH